MRQFAIVVAMDENYGIGKNGGLAWHLPADLKHFKAVTSATLNPTKKNAVIMGRKTWDSLPDKFKPLPNRQNVVLTRDAQAVFPAGVIKASTLEGALNALSTDTEGVFVIGGAQVYKQAIDHPACHKLCVTHVQGNHHCDAFFPPISKQFFPISASEPQTEDGITFHFSEYIK